VFSATVRRISKTVYMWWSPTYMLTGEDRGDELRERCIHMWGPGNVFLASSSILFLSLLKMSCSWFPYSTS
jgi:hypothetical protein